ncbi:FliM/FliN family flagellar motor C-terminal domain-containing protein [Ramlibacter humi]|uniref:FliM/FliN family flagellar motor switch protein n=1 Tax=Ramlibacter humi TaxID=2530451 RepID=A0A4Z0BCS4_9BURK|nr:FliM/FliN family flagellar motor C-terminal domain-containing protein [Ramlibacter humi]TFY97075.1 FliM/FliN family flagellar motor switch protein [Ramlibacter humi]
MQAAPGQEASPWRSREAGWELVAWTTRQTDALADAIGRALAEWRQAWGLEREALGVRLEPASSEAVLRPGWKALGPGEGWLLAPGGAASGLATMLFGKRGALAGEVADACAGDVTRRLAAILMLGTGGVSQSPMPGLGQPWSGALYAELPGTPGWRLLIGPGAVSAWCRQAGLLVDTSPAAAPRDALCSTADALAARKLALDVRLSGCELDLGALQGLRVGDVVRLGHGLQEPVRLVDAEGCSVFGGYLVARQGRMAVELARPIAH